MGQFGVGQGMSRVEDPRLLTGQGRFTDDIRLDGEAVGVVLRSPHAHAEIAAIDTAEARGLPGVLAVYTASDLSADRIGDIKCLTPLPGKNGSKTIMPPHPVLARGRVRHVGDPLAFVVAETPAQAKDAAELIEVDYRELPAVVETARALDADAPRIWDQAPDNLSLDWELGDAQATEAGFARAAHITRLELVNNRLVVNSIEPRVRPAPGSLPCSHPGRGRRLRHEELPLRRAGPGALRRAQAGPPGALDRRTGRELRQRQSGPRSRGDGGTGAGC
jgi:carbon-monoxide dehydrogenase large subunit